MYFMKYLRMLLNSTSIRPVERDRLVELRGVQVFVKLHDIWKSICTLRQRRQRRSCSCLFLLSYKSFWCSAVAACTSITHSYLTSNAPKPGFKAKYLYSYVIWFCKPVAAITKSTNLRFESVLEKKTTKMGRDQIILHASVTWLDRISLFSKYPYSIRQSSSMR